MKRFILFISTIIFIIASFFFITYFHEFRKAKVLENSILSSQIVNFKYDYGSYNGGYYEYEISKSNEKTIFTANGFNGVYLDMTTEVASSNLDDILKIVKEQNISSWNNFPKSNDDILDGYSFSLEITFENGYIISAYGYEKYPKNYNSAHTSLTKYLESLTQ